MRPGLVETLFVKDSWDAASVLCDCAELDDLDSEITDWADLHPMTGEEIHAFVKARVQFLPASWQQMVAPSRTLERGYGMCVDSARLIVVLARRNGYRARLHYFLRGTGVFELGPDEPVHVAAEIFDGGRWVWAEATIDARYGEAPLVAAERLGVDVAGIKDGPTCDDDVDPAPVALNAPAPAEPGRVIGQTGGPPLPSRLADFPDAIRQVSDLVDPLDATKVLLSESGGGLNPAARNFRGFDQSQGPRFAVGINQFAPVNWGVFAPLTADQYAQLTAAQQVPYVLKFWRSLNRRGAPLPLSARDLYWLNFLPGLFVPNAPDSHVIVDSSSGFYAPNADSFDAAHKGFITAGDLQAAIDRQEHSALWPALESAIGHGSSPGGGGGVGLTFKTGLVVAAIAVGAGAAIGKYWPSFEHDVLKLVPG